MTVIIFRLEAQQEDAQVEALGRANLPIVKVNQAVTLLKLFFQTFIFIETTQCSVANIVGQESAKSYLKIR